jgi:hypothetical protein
LRIAFPRSQDDRSPSGRHDFCRSIDELAAYTATVALTSVTARRNPGVVYDVYLSGGGSQAAHIGNLSLYGVERTPHGLNASFDVTDELRELFASEAWDRSSLSVFFVPLSLYEDGSATPIDAEPVLIADASVYLR